MPCFADPSVWSRIPSLLRRQLQLVFLHGNKYEQRSYEFEGPKAPNESASETRRERVPEAEEKVKGVACHKMTICTDFAHVICA